MRQLRLSVWVCAVSFLTFPMIPSPKTSNRTIEGIAATAAVNWQVL